MLDPALITADLRLKLMAMSVDELDKITVEISGATPKEAADLIAAILSDESDPN